MSDEALIEHLPLVKRIAARASRHCPRLADETLSDAMLEALKLSRDHDPAKAKLSTHLARHLPLRLVDHLRLRTGRRGRKRVECLPLTEDAPEPAGPGQDQEDAVAELLRPLVPSRRRIMRAWACGEKMAAIGRRLGLSESRISLIITESLKELREHHAQS